MKPTSILFLTIALAGLFFSACNNRPSSNSEIAVKNADTLDINEVRKIIEDQTNRFTAAHITKDTAFLNNIFTQDARVLPPNSEAVIGRKDIAQLNFDWVNYGVYEFKETSTNLYGTTDFLIDEGTYFLRYGDEKTVENGKYINIWKQENGEWKIYSNIWNTSEQLGASE